LQIQRKFEREIRSAKREKVAFDIAVKESSDPELKAAMQSGSDYANQQIKDKQAKMRDFINQTKQDRDYFREQNYGKTSYMQTLENIQQSQKNNGNVLTSALDSGNIKNDESSNVNLEFYFDEHQEKYDEYLKNVPIKHQKALKYAADNCATYEINDDKITYAYDGKLDTLLYNPQHKNFKFYDFNTTYTHELSHYLDKHFFKSFEDSQFSKSISENSYSNQYISECLEKHNINIDKELELSDIISALTLNKFDVKYGHETVYWEQQQKYHREKEIFVNLFNLEAQENETIINFVQSSFPDVWDNYFKICEKGLANFIEEVLNS